MQLGDFPRAQQLAILSSLLNQRRCSRSRVCLDSDYFVFQAWVFSLTEDLDLTDQDDVDFIWHFTVFEKHVSRLKLPNRKLAQQLLLLLFRATFQSDLRREHIEELFLAPLPETLRVEELVVDL